MLFNCLMLADRKALEGLQQDHSKMRAKLRLLKAALNGGPEHLSRNGTHSRADSRKLCRELAGDLKQHIRKESLLAKRCCVLLGRLEQQDLERLILEHDSDWDTLRIINYSLASDGQGWIDQAGPLMVLLIANLKQRMDAQEHDLFPFLEDILTGKHSGNGAAYNGNGNGFKRNGKALLPTREHGCAQRVERSSRWKI